MILNVINVWVLMTQDQVTQYDREESVWAIGTAQLSRCNCCGLLKNIQHAVDSHQ